MEGRRMWERRVSFREKEETPIIDRGLTRFFDIEMTNHGQRSIPNSDGLCWRLHRANHGALDSKTYYR